MGTLARNGSGRQYSRRAALGGLTAIPVATHWATGAIARTRVAGGPPQDLVRNNAESVREFLALRGRLDGGPAYWFSWGLEFLVGTGASVPVNGRVSAMVALTRATGADEFVLPYFEANCSVTPFDFRFEPDHRHPLTGAPIPTAMPHVDNLPRDRALLLDAAADLSQVVRGANDYRAVYAGHLTLASAFGPLPAAVTRIDVTTSQRQQPPDSFTEVTTWHDAGGVTSEAAWRPARVDSLVHRPVLNPFGAAAGPAAIVGQYTGHKFETPRALLATLSPSLRAAFGPFFEAVPEWVQHHH